MDSQAIQHAWWFLFYNDQLLVEETAGITKIPLICDGEFLNLKLAATQYIGELAGHPCYVANLDDPHVPARFCFKGLWQLYGQLADDAFWFTTRAYHIISWLNSNRFCSRCASQMHVCSQELALQCTHCDRLVYPRISPAVIVAVIKDDKLLLARSARFPGIYSVIAGFVEPGETLEACVKRELKEEVGIEVTNITYFGNQPWPFPDALMIAFTAQYAKGEITIDNQEIIEAGWFSAHELPQIPPKISIARKLIDWFATHAKGPVGA